MAREGELVHKNAGRTVRQILKGKKGAVKDARLPAGAPTWSAIDCLPWEEIVAWAAADVPGYKTIKKLLGDRRFDR